MALLACTTGRGHQDGGGPVVHPDGGGIDGGADAHAPPLPDAGRDAYAPDAWVDRCSPDCMDAELCDPMGGGDGIDNDCNGEVDETCACTAGTARSCFPGRPDRRGVGSCADGMEL